MPYLIYERDRFENKLIGVCKANEVDAILAEKNAEFLINGETPQVIEFKQQIRNIKKNIENLKNSLVKIDRSMVAKEAHANLTKILNLANMEVDKKISEGHKNIRDIEDKIRTHPSGPPFFAEKIKLIKNVEKIE